VNADYLSERRNHRGPDLVVRMWQTVQWVAQILGVGFELLHNFLKCRRDSLLLGTGNTFLQLIKIIRDRAGAVDLEALAVA